MKYILIGLILASCCLDSYSFASKSVPDCNMEAAAADKQNTDDFKVTMQFGILDIDSVNSLESKDVFAILFFGLPEDVNDNPENVIREIKDAFSEEYNADWHSKKGCEKNGYYYIYNHSETISIPKTMLENDSEIIISFSTVVKDENNKYNFDHEGLTYYASVAIDYNKSDGTVKTRSLQ